MKNNYHSDTKPTVEKIAYIPFIPETGNFVSGSRTVNRVSRPDIASAQFT